MDMKTFNTVEELILALKAALGEDVYEKFEHNDKKSLCNYFLTYEEDLEDYLGESPVFSPRDAISCSFDWAHSEEDMDFWSEQDDIWRAYIER